MKQQTLIRPAELAELDQDQVLILDCRFELADTARGRRDHDAAHIPGAVYADLDEDLSGPGQASGLGRHPPPTAESLAASLARLGWDGHKPVVAYDDHSGAIAARAWWLLRVSGHDKVAVLEGGWAAWRDAGLPEESSPIGNPAPRMQPAPFNLSLDTRCMVSSQQLQAELQDHSCLLIDARARERYLGEVEPIDAVAGHVPGARNRPYMDNLDPNGRFKDADTLRATFSELLGDYRPEQVVHMCGSGVTACHNILAMEHAGLTGSRLYPPSWSGWISDPDRAIASGA
ncbi:MAG: sulfurtransferase [Rhodanobacteraceae bacterium]